MTRLVVKFIWVKKYIDSCHHCPLKVLLMTCNAVFESRDFLAALRSSKVRSKFLNLCFSNKISSGGLSVLAFYITCLGRLHIYICVCVSVCVRVCVCAIRQSFAITGKFQKIWTQYIMTPGTKDTWFIMTSQGWYKCLSCLHLPVLYILFPCQSAVLPRTNFHTTIQHWDSRLMMSYRASNKEPSEYGPCMPATKSRCLFT